MILENIATAILSMTVIAPTVYELIYQLWKKIR